MIGQPVLGRPDNVMNISREMVTDYHKNNYVGQNIIVIGTGNVNHKDLEKFVNRTFGKLPKKANTKILNTEKPKFES